MVQSLCSCGANSIWEYSLLNPTSTKGGKRKPQPTDPLHPNKAEFIRAKHQLLAYVFKPSKDSELVTESDLSKQLHSSVRTPNLETSLRLLSQGADPNYFHPEKNSTPLAVAGKAGQPFQVELLLVYGADPAAVDLVERQPVSTLAQRVTLPWQPGWLMLNMSCQTDCPPSSAGAEGQSTRLANIISYLRVVLLLPTQRWRGEK